MQNETEARFILWLLHLRFKFRKALCTLGHRDYGNWTTVGSVYRLQVLKVGIPQSPGTKIPGVTAHLDACLPMPCLYSAPLMKCSNLAEDRLATKGHAPQN